MRAWIPSGTFVTWIRRTRIHPPELANLRRAEETRAVRDPRPRFNSIALKHYNYAFDSGTTIAYRGLN